MSEIKSNADEADRPEPVGQKASPDIIRCRARRSGFGDWIDCLMPDPPQCAYAATFGPSYFCLHPERADIAARASQPNPRHDNFPPFC